MEKRQTRQLSPFDKTQADITYHNEVAILNALKDYLAKKYNTNFANIKTNLDAIKNALNGLSGVTQHLGIPHEPSATPPPNPNEYDWYFDTAHNQFKMYHGSAWVMIADLANLINLDAKYLKITDAARDYLPRADFQTALNLKANESDTYTRSIIDGKLDLKQTKLTTDQQAVVDANPFTQAEKDKLANVISSTSGVGDLTTQVATNKADIASNKAAIATKQDVITGKPLSVLQANPFTDEALAKVNTAIQQADISDVLRTGDVYSNSEIDQKVSGAKGQFETGTLKELNDIENGIDVPNEAHKILTLPEVVGLEQHRNDITRQTLANFVDRVIFKDSNTLEYYDTILNIEVKDAAAVTSGNIMTLTNKLDVYGRIYVEGTSFGAVFKVPCAVEYNFLDKDKGIKFYGTKDQTYKWELFGKYEGGQRVNWIKFSGSSTMSITDNPGVASPTWTIQPMPYEVKMSDIFDKDHKLALIKLDYDVLPADGDHILNLEYLTTLPYVEARFASIIAQLQNNITNATPNFSTDQQLVINSNAFTDAYKGKLDNAPDNINTALGGKLDASTYNAEKVNFLTNTDISGKADTSYVNTELADKQDILQSDDKLAIAKLFFTEALKTKYDGYESTLNTKADASALTSKVDTATLTTELAKKQNVLTDPEKTAISKLSFTDTLKNKYDAYATSKADASATTTALGLKANKTDVTNSLALKQDKLSAGQLALLGTGAIKFTQAVDDRITTNTTDIIHLKGKGSFLGKFADASARDTALQGVTLVNGDYVILGDPAVRWVYDLRSGAWVEDISHSAAISSITLDDVAAAQDPKISTAKQEAITSANTHTDGAIATLTTTVNGKQDAIDAGKLALLDGAVKFTATDKNTLDSALQSHQDVSGKADTSWVTTELNKKQNNLSDDQKAVLAGKVFTQTEKDKLARAITSQQDISGKADTTYVNQELAKKQGNLSSDQLAVVNASPFTSNEKTKLAGLSELTNSNILTQLSLPQSQLTILQNTKEFTQAEKTKLASAITSHQNISGKADSTWVTSQLNSKFTQNSAKLVVNDTSVNPGDAKIGHGYKGIQSYGEGGSIQYYGKDAVNTVSLGQGSRSEVTVGKNATGSVMIGSDSSTIAADHQKLIHGNKSANFSSIIDVAGGNVFTTAYKTKLDSALQPSAITSKVDTSTMNAALANKQDNLNQHQKDVLAGNPYTTDDKNKVASALQQSSLSNYYTSSQIDTKLNTKKDTFSDNLLLKSGSSVSLAKFLTNTRYHTQSYLDDAGAYVGAFNANETKYATVKLIGEDPALFGHDGSSSYTINFKDIQTKLSDTQLAVTNGNTFTNAYKTKLDNTASQAEIATLAKKDLSNVVTTQEKASFISNLQRIGVQVSLFNEFKGVHPSDPASPHNDLDWYINDSTYEIKVWHNNSWHNIGKPTHTLTNAEVLTALGLTQTDITNLKYITNVRSTLSSIIGKGNEISHLPANTITALNDKADKDTTYTRVDIDTKLNNIKQSAISSATSQAATSTTTAINNAVSGKVNAGDVYTRTQSDGRYATKTELAAKQDNLASTRLLESSSNASTAFIKSNGTYKAQAYAYDGGVYVGAVNGGRLAVIKMDGNTPKIVYNADGSHSKEIELDALKTKIDSITTSAIANAKLDHSQYALKSELSAAVDLDNTLKFIDTKMFSGRSYAADHILPNNTRIYDNFVIEGTDGIIGTTEVTVNTGLRGWQTLGRIKPGSHGYTYSFDIRGYYESDGGISKFRAAVGGAGSNSAWSYVRERIKVKALASQSKGMGEAINDFVLDKTGNVITDVSNLKSDVLTIKTNAADLSRKVTSESAKLENVKSRFEALSQNVISLIFDSGEQEDYKVGK